MSAQGISRETIINTVMEVNGKELPKLANKTATVALVHTHFNRVGADLPDMFDALFYAIIEGVCGQMKMSGIKQPNAQDFIAAFKTVNGIYLNIGSLSFNNFKMTPEMYEAAKAELRSELLKDLKKYLKAEGVEVAEEEEFDEAAANDELEEAFGKYEGILEDDDNGQDEDAAID